MRIIGVIRVQSFCTLMSTPIRIELPTGLAVGSVNAYLFTEPEPVLIDAGVKSDACWDALTAGLAEHGLAPRDVSRIVITHPHVDHFGLAARLAEESDATVWICDLGVPWLVADGDRWAQRLSYYRDDFLAHAGIPPETAESVISGMRALEALADPVPPGYIVPFRPDGVLQLGGLAWDVLHTPGHASMMTCFYQPDTRQLISADMLLAITPTPVIEQPPPGATRRVPALPQYMTSLARVEALAVDDVYPGHGRPFGDRPEGDRPMSDRPMADHRAVIARQRGRILARRDECLALVREGIDTIPALVERMYAHQPRGVRLAGLWMLVGYLDLLVQDGRIAEETRDGVWRYAAV
jgi:glyoxylase-like metal-dependent hydrolase (beta-lactamase superfamily II)